MDSADRLREQLFGLPALVKRAVLAHSCRGVFVDMTGFGGPIDPVDRILLASRLAETWPQGVRIAALTLPEQVNRVIEHIASARHVDIRAFNARGDAMAWLAAVPVAER